MTNPPSAPPTAALAAAAPPEGDALALDFDPLAAAAEPEPVAPLARADPEDVANPEAAAAGVLLKLTTD